MTPRPTRRGLLAGAACSVALAGCSGTSPRPGPTPSASPRPTRVAALDWQRAEDLVALGVQPVAASRPHDLAALHPVLALAGRDVPDVGAPTGPYDLDVLRRSGAQVALATNMVITPASADQVRPVLPLVLAREFLPGKGLAAIRAGLDQTAALVGRQDRAQQLQDAFNREVWLAREALRGRLDAPLVLLSVEGTPAAPVLRSWTASSTWGQLVDQLGGILLPGDGDAATGSHVVTPAGLQEARRILWWRTPVAEPLVAALAKDPTWSALPAVRAGRVTPVLAGRLPTGGVASMTACCTELRRLFGTPSPSPRPSVSVTPSATPS